MRPSDINDLIEALDSAVQLCNCNATFCGDAPLGMADRLARAFVALTGGDTDKTEASAVVKPAESSVPTGRGMFVEAFAPAGPKGRALRFKFAIDAPITVDVYSEWSKPPLQTLEQRQVIVDGFGLCLPPGFVYEVLAAIRDDN